MCITAVLLLAAAACGYPLLTTNHTDGGSNHQTTTYVPRDATPTIPPIYTHRYVAKFHPLQLLVRARLCATC